MTADPERQNRALWYALAGAGVLLLILLIAFMRKGAGVTQAAGPTPGPSVALAPPPKPGPSVALAPSPTRPAPAHPDPMTAAVEAYLAQVEQIEASRKQVVNNLVPAMATAMLARQMGGMESLFNQLDDDYESGVKQAPKNQAADQARATIDGYITDLQNTARRLAALRPPQPANALQSAYYSAFGTYLQVLLRIRNTLDTPQGQEQQAAMQLQTESPRLESAKTAALAQADAELTRLTQRYGLTRRFSISDQSAQGVLQ